MKPHWYIIMTNADDNRNEVAFRRHFNKVISYKFTYHATDVANSPFKETAKIHLYSRYIEIK